MHSEPEDHQLIAGILATVGDLAHEAAGATPERRDVIRRELSGLAVIMESHFGYEERAMGDAIDDQVQDTGSSRVTWWKGEEARLPGATSEGTKGLYAAMPHLLLESDRS